MQKVIFILIVTASLFTSCKSSKTVQSPVPVMDSVMTVVKPVEIPTEDTIAVIKNTNELIGNNFIKASTFSAKIDVKYQDAEGKKYDVNAHVRMYYDSVIWVSVTGLLGIEGLRGLITHDSVQLIDKQNKVYTSQSISYLQELTALPLNLVSLQDLLIGNPVFWSSNITSFSRTQESISLLAIGKLFTNLLTINSENKSITSSKLDDILNARMRSSYLLYKDYENKKGFNFSVNRFISVTDKKNIEIELQFKQYSFNETLSFPFNVPKNYKRN